MMKWIKKHFIPHEGNGHQPHFLRGKNTRLLVLIVFMLEIGALTLPYIPPLSFVDNSNLAAVLPSVLDDLTNQNRESQDLAILTVNPLLNKVAELKARDMAEKGYFSHVSPEGKAPWYWFNQVGYKYEYAGENLAIDFTDSQDVTIAWMNSPTHKANIVKNAYTEMGTGIATGTFEGSPTIFVAQVYGKPAQINVVDKPVVAKSVTPVLVEKIETLIPTVKGTSTEIVNTEPPQTYVKSTVIDKYSTSPRHIINIVLFILAILVIIALLFKLFVRMDKKHPRLITNGLIVLVLILGIYVVNNYLANRDLENKTSFTSFGEE